MPHPIPILIIALFALAPYSSSAQLDNDRATEKELQEWVAGFYEDQKFCATATVDTAVINQKHVLVHLDIDPRWQSALIDLNPAVIDNWYAIHCPLPLAAVEHLLNNRDIIIVDRDHAKEPESGLSCRAFDNLMQKNNDSRKESARSRISSLLEKFGLSGNN